MTPAYWSIMIISILVVVWIGWRSWLKIPDDCEVEGCSRQGVRGNENIIKGIIMCDYCHSKAMDGHPIRLKRKEHGSRS